MNFIADISSHILPFLVVLTVLVFIHEMGHFLLARRNGVKVDVFSIGFGPELLGWNDKVGTRWKISLIPLGGYIKMYGDADASSKPDHEALHGMSEDQKSCTLQSKTIPQRISVVAAGPIANYLFAIVLMTGLFFFKGIPTQPATIGAVLPDSLAHACGILPNDTITKINSTDINTFQDLVNTLGKAEGQDIALELKRPKGKISSEAQLFTTEKISVKMISIDKVSGEKKPVSKLGVSPHPSLVYEPVSFFNSAQSAVSITWNLSCDTLKNFGQMIIGKKSSDELGGILAIGGMAKQSADSGIATLLWFMAILSINLGLINLLPVPVLDGGHILFYLIEAVRGKPVGEKAQEYAYFIGLMLVLGLMFISTWNDLIRYKVLAWIPFFK